MMMPSIAQAPANYSSSSRESLESHIAFSESKTKVARILLDAMDQQNELGALTRTEQDLMYYAINTVLNADPLYI